MLSTELKKKLKYIEIKSKQLLNGFIIGNKNSSVKGAGLEFDQIREYQQGDDVRFLDWKNSAKGNQFFVKQFFEERSQDIIIMLDVSSSMDFATDNFLKNDVARQIALTLSYIVHFSKDNLGLLLFSDEVEIFIAPTNLKDNIINVIDKIITSKSVNRKTDINKSINFLAKKLKSNSTIIIISDFIDQNILMKNLERLSSRHTVYAIRCNDKNEFELPDVGLVETIDIETGNKIILDLRLNNKKLINNFLDSHFKQQNSIFKKSKIKFIDIDINKDCFLQIENFFK